MDSFQEGIVIVSMSNLFHILDKERTNETKIFKMNSRKTTLENRRVRKLTNTLYNDFSHTEDKYYANTETSERSLKRVEQYIIKNKKSFCDYFFKLVLLCFILLLLNECYIWSVLFIFSKPKNKMYCFDSDSREFKICENAEFCPISGKRDFIYTNDTDNYSNVDIIKEMDIINKEFIDFYIKETTIFSFLNRKISKNKSTLSKFGVTIILTKNENYLFHNTFRTGCDNYKVNLIVSAFIAIIIGNLMFGMLADIVGRKNIIIITSCFINYFNIILYIVKGRKSN